MKLASMQKTTAAPARRATSQQVCDVYQVTPRTLQNWRDKGVIPFIRINQRVVRYDLEEVEKALRK